MWRRLRQLVGKRVEYEERTFLYTLPRRYTPDFTVLLPGREPVFLEVKGYFRAEDRTKMRRVKHDNPTADILLVFAYDNKLSAKNEMRYSEWAIKYGFPYCVGQIPEGWFTENG